MTYLKQQHVVSQKADDTLVLLNPKDGQYYALNEVGGDVWDLCDGSRSEPDIVRILADTYDAPEAVLATDVAEILGDLHRANLVVAR